MHYWAERIFRNIAPVTQLVEYYTFNVGVASSSLAGRTTKDCGLTQQDLSGDSLLLLTVLGLGT